MPVLELFATRSDLLSLLVTVERKPVKGLKYVRAGLLETTALDVARSACQIEALGISKTGRGPLRPNFLVMPLDTEVFIRSVPQRRGGIRYSVSLKGNPSAVILTSGGEYDGKAVISSLIETFRGDEIADVLLDKYRKELRRSFKKADYYWLGPEAEQALHTGLRLTADIKAPIGADLQLQHIGKARARPTRR